MMFLLLCRLFYEVEGKAWDVCVCVCVCVCPCVSVKWQGCLGCLSNPGMSGLERLLDKLVHQPPHDPGESGTIASGKWLCWPRASASKWW